MKHLTLLSLPIALITLTACNDQKFSTYVPPPVVTIIEPSSGSTFYEDQDIIFRAVVESDAFNSEEITHTWVAGTTSLCEEAPADADGIASCVAAIGDSGEFSVQVSITDPEGNRANATTTVNIAYNNAPTITLHSPTEGQAFQANDLVVINATVDDAEDESNELTITVTSSQDGDLFATSSPTTGGDYSEGFNLQPGSHLLKVTATDTAGKTGQASVTVSVNNPPSSPIVTITPDDAVSDQGLQANIETPAYDPDGDTLTYAYTWYVNGSEYASGVPSIAPNVVKRDEYWEVHVSASDGVDLGPAGVAGVTIGNRVPEIASVSLAPSTPGELDDIVATPQNWYDAEGDPESYRYLWYHNGAATSETTNTFPAHYTTRGDTVYVEVTPKDSYGSGEMVASATATVSNTPPEAPTVVISPSSPERDDNLSCGIVTPSTDPDGDTVTYTYNWYKNGVITGETSNVITSSLTSDGETWECVVTPNDGEDDGDPGSDTVSITDFTAPDDPILDDLSPYRNDDYAVLTGTCEAGCALVFYLSDDTGSWTETSTCTSGGAVSHTVYLTRGSTTEAYATCEDTSGNVSGDSNTVSTEACDPYDEYENSSGYGDSYSNAINEWGTLDDSGTTTIEIAGNALETSDEDWYVISTDDLSSHESTNWWEDYNFEVELTEGSSVYELEIFDGGTSLTTPVCSTGTTEMDYFFEDPTWGRGQGCSQSPVYPDYTNCPDFSTDWYIVVTRRADADPSCESYEISITNGVW